MEINHDITFNHYTNGGICQYCVSLKISRLNVSPVSDGGRCRFADVDPGMRALGHRIARRDRRMQPVHIPALRGSEWAHLLRALEKKRAFN
ncbi:hypothetical protein ACLBOM_36950 [Escherichia coli]